MAIFLVLKMLKKLKQMEIEMFSGIERILCIELADNILGQLDVAFMNLNKEDNLYFENGIWFKLFFFPFINVILIFPVGILLIYILLL